MRSSLHHNFEDMKKTYQIISFCFLSITGIHLSNAQVIQDKLYILNETCYLPQVEDKIGQIQYGPVSGKNPLRQTKQEFPIGLLGATGNSIKYTIYKGKVFAASFRERNGVYWGGPAIVAIDTSDFRPLDTAYSRELLAVTGKTTDLAINNTFLDGNPLRRAIYNSNFKRIVYDFSANDNGVFLFIHEKNSLQIRKILPAGREIRRLGSGIKSMSEEEEKNRSELIVTVELTGEVSSISAFSIFNELYVFIHDDGRLYQVSNASVIAVHSNIAGDRSYKDHALVVDRDNDQVYLLLKQAINEMDKSFNDILSIYGLKIKMN